MAFKINGTTAINNSRQLSVDEFDVDSARAAGKQIFNLNVTKQYQSGTTETWGNISEEISTTSTTYYGPIISWTIHQYGDVTYSVDIKSSVSTTTGSLQVRRRAGRTAFETETVIGTLSQTGTSYSTKTLTFTANVGDWIGVYHKGETYTDGKGTQLSVCTVRNQTITTADNEIPIFTTSSVSGGRF